MSEATPDDGIAGPTPSPRDQLLARVVDHVAEHGFADASLRELAAGAGTSHRMLLHHFGSRAGLLAAVVATVEERQRLALEVLAADVESPGELIRALWDQVCDPDLWPEVRLFFEVLALALQGRPGTEGYLDRLTEPWLDHAAAVAERIGTPADRDDLRLGVAVTRGLLIEVLASGDPAPATASLERFIAWWDAGRA